MKARFTQRVCAAPRVTAVPLIAVDVTAAVVVLLRPAIFQPGAL